MIKRIIVKNFAIIEDITLDFKDHMTAITGQTGAGKSLIIDTINLLLGERADTDMIRYNTNKAEITGIFSNDKRLDDIFLENSIEIKDDITIERTISFSKSSIKVNNTIVSLNVLKKIGYFLADMHNQNDTFKLFSKDNYLGLLDPISDDKFNKLLNTYTKELYNYQNIYKDYEMVINNKNRTIERLEFLEYEHEELDKLNLVHNLDKELEEEINKLSNYDKILNSLTDSYNLLDNEINVIDNLYDSARALEKITDYSANYKEFYDKLMDSYYNLDEVRMNIHKELNNLDFDPEDFDLKQELLNDINKAKDKYHMTLDELIEYNNKISLEISIATNYDEVIKEKKDLLLKSFDKLKLAAISLSDYRKKIALDLEKNITSLCKDLDLENTEFKVEFKDVSFDDYLNKTIFLQSGIDEIDFLINFNKGEELKPLYKVASGGEASRVMLAFKAYFSNKNAANLVIFDEIDSGVSGVTAMKIAKKMKEISKNIQLIAITHLPTVAAIAEQELYISKETIASRTTTKVEELSYDRRVEEIASMISGDKISLYAIEYAKELLKNS